MDSLLIDLIRLVRAHGRTLSITDAGGKTTLKIITGELVSESWIAVEPYDALSISLKHVRERAARRAQVGSEDKS